MLAENPRGSAGSTCSRLGIYIIHAVIQSTSDITESLTTNMHLNFMRTKSSVTFNRVSWFRSGDVVPASIYDRAVSESRLCWLRMPAIVSIATSRVSEEWWT